MRQATSGVTRRTISLPLLAIAAVAAVTLRSKLRILDAKPQPQRGSRVPRSASAKRAAKEGFFKLNLVSLAFTFGTIAFMLLTVGAVVLVPLLFGQIGLRDFAGVVISVLRWPARFMLLGA